MQRHEILPSSYLWSSLFDKVRELIEEVSEGAECLTSRQIEVFIQWSFQFIFMIFAGFAQQGGFFKSTLCPFCWSGGSAVEAGGAFQKDEILDWGEDYHLSHASLPFHLNARWFLGNWKQRRIRTDWSWWIFWRQSPMCSATTIPSLRRPFTKCFLREESPRSWSQS